MYQCECGTILRNILPYQLEKHRRSKKHLNCLLLQHMEWDKQKQKKNQPEKPIQIDVEPTLEIANNDPVKISFD
tara:strand:- start:719 stop:940 length:222 start_codon:yes stop_codon:yes gene_type:complete